MVTEQLTTLSNASQHSKNFTQQSPPRHGPTLRFWVARPVKGGAILTPPVGIWRGLLGVNDLFWRK